MLIRENGGERKKFFKSNVTVVKSEKSTSDPKGYINWAKGNSSLLKLKTLKWNEMN